MGLGYLSWTSDIIYEPLTLNGRGQIPGIGREVMPSGFANDPDRSRFAADLKWMKEDRNGGRKDRRIELGERFAEGEWRRYWEER